MAVGTTGDPLGTRGDGGKQFVDQFVDRDQLEIATGGTPTGEVVRGEPLRADSGSRQLAAGDRREHVDHRTVGNDRRAVVHGDLVEQDAGRREHAGEGLAIMGRGQGRDEAVDGGSTADGDQFTSAASGALGHVDVAHGRGVGAHCVLTSGSFPSRMFPRRRSRGTGRLPTQQPKDAGRWRDLAPAAVVPPPRPGDRWLEDELTRRAQRRRRPLATNQAVGGRHALVPPPKDAPTLHEGGDALGVVADVLTFSAMT
jgi:hypothetical protein